MSHGTLFVCLKSTGRNSALTLFHHWAIYQRIGTDLIGKLPPRWLRPPSFVGEGERGIDNHWSATAPSRSSPGLFFLAFFSSLCKIDTRFPNEKKQAIWHFFLPECEFALIIISTKMTSTGVFEEAGTRCRHTFSEKEVPFWSRKAFQTNLSSPHSGYSSLE